MVSFAMLAYNASAAATKAFEGDCYSEWVGVGDGLIAAHDLGVIGQGR
jgi:hypothetical protein